MVPTVKRMVPVTRTYEIDFFPDAFDCTIRDFVERREQLRLPSAEFTKCFICGRRLQFDRIPIVASVAGTGNRFSCTACYEKYREENRMEEMQECRSALLAAFPGSFINERDEFIAHPRTNQYICLGNCETPIDIECKVLEWFSRPAYKTAPYAQEWRNRKLHEFMLNGINAFMDSGFTEEEIAVVYEKLGNAINHEKTIRFIKSDYDFDIL